MLCDTGMILFRYCRSVDAIKDIYKMPPEFGMFSAAFFFCVNFYFCVVHML